MDGRNLPNLRGSSSRLPFCRRVEVYACESAWKQLSFRTRIPDFIGGSPWPGRGSTWQSTASSGGMTPEPDEDAFECVRQTAEWLALKGRAAWRRGPMARLTVLAATPAVRAAPSGASSKEQQWDAVEQSVESAIDRISDTELRDAALDSFGFTAPTGGWGVQQRDDKAGGCIPKDGGGGHREKWYRESGNAKYCGRSPRNFVASLVAAALFEVDDPETFVRRYLDSTGSSGDTTETISQSERDVRDLRSVGPAPSRTCRPGVIRDPVHGYIPFTSLEAALLEEPIVQRLRYISQMAASHHVFPSANTTRFEHSIGAMHAASRLFTGAIENTDEQFRDVRVIEGVCALAGSDYKWRQHPTDDERERWKSDEKALRASGLAWPPHGDVRVRVGLMLVEQALRIATLLHDLGHMPLSHDMELVLEELVQNETAARRWPAVAKLARAAPKDLHEAIGQRIGQYLLEQRFRGRSLSIPLHDGLRQLADRALDLAITIVAGAGTSPPDTDSERGRAWLYTLVNGEIDADRCDYILRDGRAHSIPGVSFDLDRLVRSVIVVELSDDGTWALALKGGGVGAFEELLVARWRLYVWGVYHHKAQAIALAMRSGVLHLIGQDTGNDMATFVDLVDDLLAAPRSLSDQPPVTDPPRQRKSLAAAAAEDYVAWDDNRIIAMFRAYAARTRDAAADDMLTYLYRRAPGYQSLWKRGTDLARDEIKRVNAAERDEDAMSAWRAHARTHDIHLVPLGFKAFAELRSGESEMQVLVAGAPESVSLRSSLMAALRDAWKTREPHVYAFVRRSGWTNPGDRFILKRTIVDAL